MCVCQSTTTILFIEHPPLGSRRHPSPRITQLSPSSRRARHQALAAALALSSCEMHATAASQGTPVVFFVDVLHAVINSVFNKNYHVKVGQWASKRADTGGPANIGEGKSPGMKCFVNTMVDVLSANMRHAVGYKSDGFHFQQSGTSASAIDKLLNCDGFLAICCPDAAWCLCPTAATQRTGMSSHTPTDATEVGYGSAR